jgi:hypothetical protein
MIWGFFDESGEHDKASGRLRRLTIGGAFASFEAWESFSIDWAALLQWAGITAFHMTDFEARKGPYGEWSNCKRRKFLNAALEIMAAHVDQFHGFTNTPTTVRRPLQKSYEAGLIDTILHAARGGAYGDEPIALVFAINPEFSLARAETHLKQISAWYENVRALQVADPVHTCPLQAADIIAYEVSRLQREDRSERYPLRRLGELGARFRYSSGS